MKIPFLSSLPDIRALWASRDTPEHARSLSILYWRALLLITLLIVLGSLVWGGLKLLNAITDLGEANALAPRGAAPLNRVQLKNIIDTFDARRAAYEAAMIAQPRVDDPSK